MLKKREFLSESDRGKGEGDVEILRRVCRSSDVHVRCNRL